MLANLIWSKLYNWYFDTTLKNNYFQGFKSPSLVTHDSTQELYLPNQHLTLLRWVMNPLLLSTCKLITPLHFRKIWSKKPSHFLSFHAKQQQASKAHFPNPFHDFSNTTHMPLTTKIFNFPYHQVWYHMHLKQTWKHQYHPPIIFPMNSQDAKQQPTSFKPIT
jgi:hypothetical protein